MVPIKDNVRTARRPIVTLALIAISFVLFGYQLILSDAPQSGDGRSAVSERGQFSITHGAIPDRLTHPGSDCGVASAAAGVGKVLCGDEGLIAAGAFDTAPWLTSLITSLFLSAGLLQLLLNTLFLWLLGNTLEDDLGWAGLVALYLFGGVFGLYAQSLIEPGSTLPVAGAAGGVAAVLGGYLVLHARARVLMMSVIPFFAGFVEVPVIPLVTGWLLLQFLPAISELSVTGIAEQPPGPYLVGLGGFLFGAGIIRLFGPTRPPQPVADDSR